MALGLLLVLFMVMSIISVMGLVLLFLLKGEKRQWESLQKRLALQ